jgi:hypothetical protein
MAWPNDEEERNQWMATAIAFFDTTTRPYITNKNAITNCFNGATNYGTVAANQGLVTLEVQIMKSG